MSTPAPPKDLPELVASLRSEKRAVAHVGIFDLNAYFRERRVRIDVLEAVFGEGGTFVNVLPRWDSGEAVYHPGPFVGEYGVSYYYLCRYQPSLCQQQLCPRFVARTTGIRR